MKRIRNRILRLIAALLLVLHLPLALPGRAAVVTGLEGKTLSILGDSISTFAGVSNNPGYNGTIGGNAVFYHPGTLDVFRQDTWWQQTADRFGLRLLVNNSWSGSCMYMEGAGTPGAWEGRCVQLHSAGGEDPDIIAIYLGTNDQDYFADSLGTFREIDFEGLITAADGRYTYSTPTTCMEAYAIALHKISQRYPEAEIYCFTLLQRPYQNPDSLVDFNTELSQLAARFGAYTVDLFQCGVYSGENAYYALMGDYVHPAPAGMDAITGAFSDSLLRNSRYVSPDTELCTVEYALDGVLVKQGTAAALVRGEAFRVELMALSNVWKQRVSVTMGGEDVTESCYAEGVISIDAVTGDLVITAYLEKPEIPPLAQWMSRFWAGLVK